MNGTVSTILILSQTAPLFEHWNKLPRPTRQFKPFAGMIGNCLSKGHDKQSLLISCLHPSQVVWVMISGQLPILIPAFGGPENTPWLDVHRRNCILLVTIISSLSYKFNI